MLENSIVVEEELVESTTVVEETKPTEVVIPEKFKSKTAEEIAQSYVELERELGRKNNEVGELRKLTDQYIHQELTREKVDPKKEDKQLEFDDLVENPQEALKSVIQPELDKINERLGEQDQQRKLGEFQAANPDYLEVGNSDEFQNWVKVSPYRVRQLEAAQAFDFDAATELLGTYKEQATVLKEAAERGNELKRAEDLKAAGTESAGTGTTTEATFTRSQLMDMRLKDRAQFELRQPEIIQAYAEGRVLNK